jgi:SWI/SNF-related matrix-associated actin-dependent regulator of chromatin subfamily A3
MAFSGDLRVYLLSCRHVADNMAFSFKHAITGAKSSEIIDAPGGIIADDMGLGKTLSMLAAVVASVNQAVQYAFSSTRALTSYWQDIIPSKCTLVVVPSACKT